MADPSSRAGERYATPQILEYAARTHHPDDRALRRAFEAPKRHGMPEIQLGPAEGRLLYLLLTLIGAHKVVEIGTRLVEQEGRSELVGYLAAGLRETFRLDGVPLRLLVRKGKNPYAG